MNWRVIKTVAKKEISANVKNYWIILVALISLILNYSIIHFTVSFAGFENQGNPKAILLSLMSLQMYLLTLFALIISYDGMLQERELRTLDLLLSFPLKSSDLVLGKWIGYSVVLMSAFLIGFLPWVYSLLQMGITVSTLIQLILYSMWLGLTFTSLGLFSSSFAKDKTFVIAFCIILWVFFVFLFDIGFVGLAIASNGVVPDSYISWVLMLNPVDNFRVMSLLSFFKKEAAPFYGLNTGALKLGYSFLAMLLWTIVPLLVTMKRNFVLGKGVHYGNR